MTHSWLSALAFAAALAAAHPTFAAGAPLAWNREVLKQAPDWYASAEARRIADSVLQHQSAEGGWPKNTSLAAPPVAAVTSELGNTFDNEATTLPLAFLARMVRATGEPAYRAAFDRGLDYVLAAQYANGGWPQYYPLRGGYHDHITFNDEAMVRVLVLLREVAAGKGAYGFVDAARRERAAKAVDAGVALILRTQLKQDGKLAVWCAQYDAATLAPAWARKFEPPSLSGSESVGIVRFLMGIERPSPEVVAAVEGAVAWFQASAVRDIRMVTTTDAAGQRDKRYVREPGSEPLWARFYALDDNRPIFAGRDSVIRYDFNEIEQERRNGYSYYGTWPRDLLEKDYPAWKAKLAKG
jgi:PelA/Pel-15E family pectate lyase